MFVAGLIDHCKAFSQTITSFIWNTVQKTAGLSCAFQSIRYIHVDIETSKRQYTGFVLEVFLFSFQKRRKQLQRLRWKIRHLLCPCNSRSLGLFLMVTLIWFFISTILNSTTLTNISANVVLILYIVVNVVFLTFVITGSHVILMILFFLSNQAPGNETVKHSHHCHQLLEKPRPSCSVWLKWSVTSPQDPASSISSRWFAVEIKRADEGWFKLIELGVLKPCSLQTITNSGWVCGFGLFTHLRKRVVQSYQCCINWRE